MRVLLVPNVRYDAATSAARELAAWLSAMGFEPIVGSDDAKAVGLESFAVSPTSIGEPALAISLGGDGTILKTVHLLGEVEVPILGVNFGHLGFLSGTSAENMRPAIEATLAGECCVERRSTLRAQVFMGGREVGHYRALNEIALSRGASGRVVRAAITVNGTEVETLDGDGVVVATATGSTAYALSAGGPVVSPDVGCSVVVPIAPHALQHRAIVTGPSDVVEISLPDHQRRDACVSVDGDVMPCRRTVERVHVQRSEHDVLLVKLDGRDFYEVVRTEFFGGL